MEAGLYQKNPVFTVKIVLLRNRRNDLWLLKSIVNFCAIGGPEFSAKRLILSEWDNGMQEKNWHRSWRRQASPARSNPSKI